MNFELRRGLQIFYLSQSTAADDVHIILSSDLIDLENPDPMI